MAKVAGLQNDFSFGEIGPLAYARRSDSEPVSRGGQQFKNAIPLPQGAYTGLPGTKYVASTKSNGIARLQHFIFSTEQAYILEFGDQYMRVYRNHAQVSGPYEVATPYLEADVFELKFTQSADVIYITHPDYAPRQLTRTADNSWTLSTFDFEDGPYYPINTTATTLTLSGTSGTVTVTASAATFASTDVGRLIRWKDPANNWTWLTITAFGSNVSVTATVDGAAASAGTATSSWRLGRWSDTTGWPSCSAFHEDRLFFGHKDQRIDGSRSGDYTDFAPSDPDETVSDSHAVGFTLNAQEVNEVRWLGSVDVGLVAGTVGAEWVVRPSTQNEALTPTNINAFQTTSIGSANIDAVKIGKNYLFVQPSGKKIREMVYVEDSPDSDSLDVTYLAHHIADTGFKQLAFQSEPHSILWAVKNNGQLASCTFRREGNSLTAGWASHQAGGASDAAGTPAVIESVAVIPEPNGTYDEVWMVVQRYVNGSVVRYVEYMEAFYDNLTEQRDMYFVSAGITFDDPKTITGVTSASPGVVTTSGAHGFSDGAEVRFDDVVGMTGLNGKRYIVANSTSTTFQLTDENGANVDTSTFGTYVSGGQVRLLVTSVSGLSHLEGETVTVLGDGAAQASAVVTSGQIGLETKAATVQVGLPYNQDVQLFPFDVGAANGSTLGKIRRITRLYFDLYKSLGLSVGVSFDNLEQIIFPRTSGAPLSTAPPLYSGILDVPLKATYDSSNAICIRQSQPLPLTVRAVAPQQVTQDR